MWLGARQAAACLSPSRIRASCLIRASRSSAFAASFFRSIRGCPSGPNVATRVLDVGCGTGGMTFVLARRVGARGACTGVDISEPMIAIARARAENEKVAASFLAADAQTHAFEPVFDAIVSRFGVMFF